MITKHFPILIIILTAMYLLSNCDKSPTNDQKETPEIIDVSYFSIQNYPKVDGSTSAHPLQQLIACKILDVDFTWYDFFDGTRRINPVSSNETIKNFIRDITHNGTHGSYVNLITNKADLIIVARQPSADELSQSNELGVTIQTKAIALDAFVFILNVSNPVNNLTVEQIQGIYTGNIINWQDVGGPNAAINPYQRNKNSGSQELMEALVMKGLTIIDAPETFILSGMMGPINTLVDDPFGICYTVYFFNEFMAPREKIKLCQINGVLPDYENIASGNYFFTTEVFIAIRSDLDAKSTAIVLWKWLQTAAGKAVISESGYVPIP